MLKLICVALLATTPLLWADARAGNSVSIESKTVAAGASDVPIGINLANDIPIRALVIPLELRAITPGAFITTLKMSFGGRLDSALTDGRVTNQLGTKSLACVGGIPGYSDVLYRTENEEHPVGGSPEGALFVRFRIHSPALAPGSDVSPSVVMTVDIALTPGVFEIDTTCTAQQNHLCFVQETPLPFTRIVPAFTKSVITVSSCNCAHHGDLNGDNAIDVLDVSLLIDYVFGGSPIPITDPGCPHIDRGDVNCDGLDDIFDVIYLNDYLYSSGPGPCNPCACSPYPTHCP